MTETLRSTLRHLATFLAPGLLLLLLGLQVAFGLKGFDHAPPGLLRVLHVPGLLLGWGAVALLLPLLVWMVLDWWGYGLSGFVLKGLGSAVLGLAGAGLLGLAGGAAEGGVVGAALGRTLEGALGGFLAVALLVLMAIPALVLATAVALVTASPARLARPPAPTPPAAPRPAAARAAPPPRDPGAAPAGGGAARLFARRRHPMLGEKPLGEKEARPWYPQRRFDAQGNELPMVFGRDRDVGAIRYADEPAGDAAPPTAAAADAGAPADEIDADGGDPDEVEGLPTVAALLSRRRAAPEGAEDPEAAEEPPASDAADEPAGPVHVDSAGRVVHVAPRAAPRPPRSAPPPEPEAPAPEPAPAPAGGRRRPGGAPGARVGPAYIPQALRPDPDAETDPALPAGVRWKPESPAGPVADAAGAAPAAPAPPAARGPRAPQPARPPEPRRRLAPPEVGEPVAPAGERDVRRRVEQALRGPSRPTPAAPDAAPSLREPLRQALEAAQSPASERRYLQKLEACGIIADPADPPADPPAARPARRPRRPAAGAEAPASASTEPPPAEPAPAAPAPDPRHEALLAAGRAVRADAELVRAYEVCLDRGAASAVLLGRRLGVPFPRARELLGRLVEVGVLGPAGPTGAHEPLLGAADWAALEAPGPRA